MSTIRSAGYNIVIGNDSIASLNKFLALKKYSTHFILCDENTFRDCLPELLYHCDYLHEAQLLEVESGEQSKNLNVCVDLWKSLTESEADRKAVLINLGGGTISDLGGFVASLYKRGIDFVNVPTTLLAMADASVGGKTGIDFEGLKNHIGTITQPAAVFVNPKFLDTLPQREVLAGLAEIIKAGLIADKKLFASVTRLKALSRQKADQIISASVQIKNKIVSKDPLEKNIRKALNFGHTIGHALESFALSTQQPLLHGEAVAFGMLSESFISLEQKLITKTEFLQIEKCIRKFYSGIQLPPPDNDRLLQLMRHDKKNQDETINFTLLDGIGKFKINCAVTDELIISALRKIQ
jgi:3-dehydroquinate synthase